MPPSRMAAFPRRLAVFTAEALAQICRPVSGGGAGYQWFLTTRTPAHQLTGTPEGGGKQFHMYLILDQTYRQKCIFYS